MEQRVLGRTGLRASVLGYGVGAVRRLMPRGTPAEQAASAAQALKAGITCFDTAPACGDGEPKRKLGRVLRARVVPGIRARLPPEARSGIGGSPEQFDLAIAAAERGPLPPAALERIRAALSA